MVNSRDRRPDPYSRLKTWGVGCGLLIAIPVVLVLAVSVRTCAPLRSANEARVQLAERFGPPDEFVPPADGALAEARMVAFLEARGALRETCERFQTMQRSMHEVDDLVDEEDPSGREVVGVTGNIAEVAGNITPLVGEFFEARNQALVQAEMGLGEYLYIFVVAYRDALIDPSGPDGVFTATGTISPEVGTAIRSMLAHQLESLDGEPETDGTRETLRREIEALTGDSTRVPFSDSLPAPIAASLAPYRRELDDAYCPVTVEIEMDLSPRRALIDALK